MAQYILPCKPSRRDTYESAISMLTRSIRTKIDTWIPYEPKIGQPPGSLIASLEQGDPQGKLSGS